MTKSFYFKTESDEILE